VAGGPFPAIAPGAPCGRPPRSRTTMVSAMRSWTVRWRGCDQRWKNLKSGSAAESDHPGPLSKQCQRETARIFISRAPMGRSGPRYRDRPKKSPRCSVPYDRRKEALSIFSLRAALPPRRAGTRARTFRDGLATARRGASASGRPIGSAAERVPKGNGGRTAPHLPCARPRRHRGLRCSVLSYYGAAPGGADDFAKHGAFRPHFAALPRVAPGRRNRTKESLLLPGSEFGYD
jgi:hypothetical protein